MIVYFELVGYAAIFMWLNLFITLLLTQMLVDILTLRSIHKLQTAPLQSSYIIAAYRVRKNLNLYTKLPSLLKQTKELSQMNI